MAKRLCAPNAGGLGSIPGQGSGSHMLQLRVHMPQLKKTPHTASKKDPTCRNEERDGATKIPHAATKTWRS